MPGWGLDTETLALEVSPCERAGVGRVERRLLGRFRNQSVKFNWTETALETRKQSVTGGGSNTQRVGKWKAISEGTWEKSQVCTHVGEGREEGMGPHRIPPMPQQAYRPTS